MGDDFDLFPKRENLDPFAFGKKEKTAEKDREDSAEGLFGQENEPSELLPDLSHLSVDPLEGVPSLPDLPIGEPEDVAPQVDPGMPPSKPPSSPTAAPPDSETDFMERLLSEGPIADEKTFDEPVMDQEHPEEDAVEKAPRKAASPFVVVGGALIIIIGLLYGALTYLKRDKPRSPAVSTPPVSVVLPPKPEPPPATEQEAGGSEAAVEVQSPAEPTPPPPAVESLETEPETAPVQEAQVQNEVPPPEPEPPPVPSSVAASDGFQYSLQVGAFILDSSVAELEKKLRGLGYDPFLKEGSTTAMMNMLTVGPFVNVAEGRAALSRLKKAGVDSNMRRREDGGAIINAGSYLLEENATTIMKKIRSLGYPVKMVRREARLPMTFVRVGKYTDLEEANSAKAELREKGVEGIVVKLQ